MMNAQPFTLDTSGEIVMPYPFLHPEPRGLIWSDLSPFAQGYIAAMIEACAPGLRILGYGTARPLRFSDLAPEALASILADCEAIRDVDGYEDEAAQGRVAWQHRQSGLLATDCAPHFPPVRVYLDDAGKVQHVPA